MGGGCDIESGLGLMSRLMYPILSACYYLCWNTTTPDDLMAQSAQRHGVRGCDVPRDVNVEFLPRCRVRAQTVWSLMKRFPISCSSPWPSDTLSPRPKPAHFPTGSGQPVRRLRTSVRSSSRYQTLTISCVYAIFFKLHPADKILKRYFSG